MEAERKCVGSEYSCSRDVETPSSELSPGPWNEHVASLSQTEVHPTRDVGDRRTDVVEVSWTSAADRVKGSDSHLEQYPLPYWQPVEHIAKNWCDALKHASTDYQEGGGAENHLQSVNDRR